MPGILDQTPPPGLNPGLLSSANLVNANAPLAQTQPSAVQAMTDAMRSGALTAQDVLDRTGELGKTHRKALIELHKREIEDLKDPNLVAARHAVQLAAGQQASLSGAQAQAAQPLVAPTADITQTQLAKQAAELKHAAPGAVDAYAQIYGNIPTKSDGTPDYELAAVKGAQARGGQMWYQFAADRQKPDPAMTQKIQSPGGAEEVVYRNSQGENVTPGSPKWKDYEDIKARAFPFQSMAPGASNAPSPSASTAPTPEPTPEQRAQLVNQLGIPPEHAATMSAADVQSKLNPAETAKPIVSSRLPTGAYNPATGGMVTQAGEIPKVNEITEPLQKDKAYEDWTIAKSRYNDMVSAMQAINAVPLADQRAGKTNLNSQDLALAESVIKMFDPAGTVRQFKWEKMEHNQPIVARINDFREQLLRQGSLTPEARQSIAQIGTQHMQAIEREALNPITRAASRAQTAGHALSNVLNPNEIGLLNGNRTPNYTPPKEFVNSKTTGAGPVITLNSGQRVQRGADGQYYSAP